MCWDNALAESFFAALKNELIYRRTVFRSRDEARLAVAEYIEVFYNRQRLHSGWATRHLSRLPPNTSKTAHLPRKSSNTTVRRDVSPSPSASITATSTSTRPGSCPARRRTHPADRLTQLLSQAGPVSQIGQQPGPGVRRHAVPIRGHRNPGSTRCRLHSRSASRLGGPGPAARPESHPEQALSRLPTPCRATRSDHYRNSRAIVDSPIEVQHCS